MAAHDESGLSPPVPLYVIIPPSALFAAHWSFFLPEMLPYRQTSRRHEESDEGRRIHVSGDRLKGFQLEIVRRYNVRQHRSVGSRKFVIGMVPPQYLSTGSQSEHNPDDTQRFQRKDDEDGGGYIDNAPVDNFERLCVGIPAPGPSLNRAHETQDSSKRTRPEVRDCQWWVKQVVQALVNKGMLVPHPPNDAAVMDVVGTLPAH